MCDECKLETIRVEMIDSRNTPNVQPIIDAAFAADQSVTCCLKRKNAVHRAVFEKARDMGFRVAWGYSLRGPEEPDYYIWPANTLHTHTVRERLERHNAYEIRARDLNPKD